MEANTGYIITEENAQLLINITGKSPEIIKANLGWVALWQEYPNMRWLIMPRNVAEQRKGFKYVDSELNGLPARSEEDIRKEWSEVNKTYGEKIEELQKELDRAKLKALKKELNDVGTD